MEPRASARLTPREGRKFAFTLAPAFLGLAGILWWRGAPRVALALTVIAGLLALAGLAVPGRLGPVQRAWMGVALTISKVTTPIMLGIVYYGVITPMGLLRRTIGGNPLRRPRGDAPTFWVSRRNTPRGDLERQF